MQINSFRQLAKVLGTGETETQAARPASRPPARGKGRQQRDRSARDNAVHVPLYCGRDYVDLLVRTTNILPISREAAETFRNWLSTRRTLMAVTGETPPLPGGFFQHVHLRGCYVANADGGRDYWDAPALLSAFERDHWSDPARLATLEEAERAMRMEISCDHTGPVPGVPVFVGGCFHSVRKFPREEAERRVAKRMATWAGGKEQDADGMMTVHCTMDRHAHSYTGRSGKKLEVWRVSWEKGAVKVASFPAFLWKGRPSGQMWEMASQRFACRPVPQGASLVAGRIPHISGLPGWASDWLRSKGGFGEVSSYAAHLHATLPAGKWETLAARSGNNKIALVDRTLAGVG